MDLGGWLRSLGLGKYEAAFRDNEIGETVLPGLAAEDLKELGVAALGAAVAALRADTSVSPTAAPGRVSEQRGRGKTRLKGARHALERIFFEFDQPRGDLIKTRLSRAKRT
jgi:SAM domain (Sterile alpha motif)